MRDWRISEDLWLTLARYNAEKARGIVHTDEWQADMANLQRQFDEEQHAKLIDQGFTEQDNGIWVTTNRPSSWWRRLIGGDP